MNVDVAALLLLTSQHPVAAVHVSCGLTGAPEGQEEH
jgi:hypothetical protein